MGNLKLWKVEFEGLWPVLCGLIILAYSEQEAREIAGETIKHTDEFTIDEVQMDKAKVVFYESGDY